jgi:hypothetical protein
MKQLSRREVIAGAATSIAAAALPVRTRASAAADLIGQVWWRLADPGILVSGCGAACECCWYMRVDCAFGVHVRKIGDRFFVCGRENFFLEGDEKILREADPGFTPLPRDAEWCAKVEYATAHGLPHPYDWPEKMHAEWTG